MTSFSHPIEAVVFDIGNVLIRWQPEEHYDRWVGAERRRAMFRAVDMHRVNDLADKGGDFKQLVIDAAEQTPDFKTEIMWWHDRWLELATPAIDLSVATLRALKNRGVPVFALSNFGDANFAMSEQANAFLSEFDQQYISGRMGVAKPDARIYEMLENDCGIAAQNLLFTDDRIDNIAAAEARGWQTHLFADPKEWAELLISKQLITRADL